MKGHFEDHFPSDLPSYSSGALSDISDVATSGAVLSTPSTARTNQLTRGEYWPSARENPDKQSSNVEKYRKSAEKSRSSPGQESLFGVPLFSSEKQGVQRGEKLQSLLTLLENEKKSISDDTKRLVISKLTPDQKRLLSTPKVTGDGTMPSAAEMSENCSPNYLDDQESLILSLRMQLNREHEQCERAVQEAQENLRKRLKLQKNTYEGRLQTQQVLLDQSIQDKRTLSERCDSLSAEMKQLQQKFDQKIKEQENRHEDSMKRTKNQWDVAEKQRRQKWISQMTQEIKERTLKSVEPEIQHVLDLHKDEIKHMQEYFQDLLQQSDARAEERVMEKVREIEAAVVQRISDARAQERDLAESLYEDKISRIEAAHRIEIAKLQEESRMNSEILGRRIQCLDDELNRIQTHNDQQREKAVEAERQQAEGRLIALEKEQKEALRRAKAELDSRFELYKVEFSSDQEADFKRKLEQATAKISLERDTQLAKAMTSMSDELTRLQIDLEKNSNNRFSRIQERYHLEIDELKASVDTWKTATEEAKQKLKRYDEDQDSLKSDNRDLERKLSSALEMVKKLEGGQYGLEATIERRYSDKLRKAEEALNLVMAENEVTKQLHKDATDSLSKQIDLLKCEHEQALDVVSLRVKEMMMKKDSKIEMLRMQLLTSQEQFRKSALTAGTKIGSAKATLKTKNTRSLTTVALK